MKCVVCDDELAFRWTDTHGVGVCCNCGMPYTIYHYDENKNSVDKPPEPAITEEGVELAKAYWEEKGWMVFPMAYDLGPTRGGEQSYSGATLYDLEKWNNWITDETPQNHTP